MSHDQENKSTLRLPVVNPFATRFTRPGAMRFRCPESLIDSLRKQLLCPEVVQIVGPHGSGKTTLAITLARELLQHGIPVQLVQAWSARAIGCRIYSRGPSSGSVLFMDGFGKLNWLTRMSLRRYCCDNRVTLVPIVHRRLKGVPLLYATIPNAVEFAALSRWLQRNLPRPVISAELAKAAWIRHEGDYREAFMELYDHYQRFLSDTTRAA